MRNPLLEKLHRRILALQAALSRPSAARVGGSDVKVAAPIAPVAASGAKAGGLPKSLPLARVAGVARDRGEPGAKDVGRRVLRGRRPTGQ